MLNCIVTFLTNWKSFQMLWEEPFVIGHSLLYLWNKLYLGVKSTFVFWVVLCFYMELQIFYAVRDSGMYRAPPSDKADELSKSSDNWKYIFCSYALKNEKMHKTVTQISKLCREGNVHAEMSSNYKIHLFHA